MAGVADSATTADLQLESLELDLKSLRQERDDDRKEFHQFQETVNKNFITMQKFFDKIQDNFRRLLLDPDPGKDDAADHASVQGGVVQKDNPGGSPMIVPGRPKQLVADTPPSVTMPEKAVVGGFGTAVLRDQSGRELNMDGTLKQPYRHPNFGINKAEGMGQNAIAVQAVQGEELQEIEGTQGQVITFVDETVPLEKITESKDKTSRFKGEVLSGSLKKHLKFNALLILSEALSTVDRRSNGCGLKCTVEVPTKPLVDRTSLAW
ncbi:hypothetical protein D1007_55833 [Hordeum vulgare]|nr:hypothetical protein D1007_55833 [Hordeum vulgare]